MPTPISHENQDGYRETQECDQRLTRKLYKRVGVKRYDKDGNEIPATDYKTKGTK